MRTKDLVTHSYWWPKLQKDIEDYIKGCAQCQANKINMHTHRAPLYPITTDTETRPFQTVAMDFITKLPLSDRCDTILTITNQGCTKMALFLPCTENITAEGVAHLYLHHVFKRFGLPTKIISDQDTCFMSKFTKELCRHLGITQNISTAYHPRTDGQSECTNQWLEHYLRFWPTISRTIGRCTYQWQNSCITHGTMQQPRHHPFVCSWDMNPEPCGKS